MARTWNSQKWGKHVRLPGPRTDPMVVSLLGVYPVDLIPPVKVSIVHILVTFNRFSAMKPQIKQFLSAGKECKQCLQIAEFLLVSSPFINEFADLYHLTFYQSEIQSTPKFHLEMECGPIFWTTPSIMVMYPILSN